MSGQRRIEQVSETLTRSYPASLRPPTDQELESLRARHEALAPGEKLPPVRSSGDPSWSSMIGFDPGFGRKGLSDSIALPPREEVVDARQALRDAINERNIFQNQRQTLVAAVNAARTELESAQSFALTLEGMDTESLARWADGDRNKPVPVSSTEKRRELTAIAESASKKLAVAEKALEAAEPMFADAVARINRDIAAAQKALVLDTADELHRERQAFMIAADRRGAQLRGLMEWARKTDPAILPHLSQPILPPDQRKQIHNRLDALAKAAVAWPDQLIAHPEMRLPIVAEK